MKSLFITVLLFATTALAGGKLTLQNNFYEEGKEYRPMIGIGIYQKLIWKTAFNSWTGYGQVPYEMKEDTKWFTSKNQIDFEFERLTVSPGYQYMEHINSKEVKSQFYVRLDYKLW